MQVNLQKKVLHLLLYKERINMNYIGSVLPTIFGIIMFFGITRENTAYTRFCTSVRDYKKSTRALYKTMFIICRMLVFTIVVGASTLLLLYLFNDTAGREELAGCWYGWFIVSGLESCTIPINVLYHMATGKYY